MSLLPRFVAPAGTVLRGSDLLGWMRGALGSGRPLRALEEAFEARYGLKHVFFLSSGRAGMTIIFRTLAERSAARGESRDEVIVPGYTCYSVAASAVRAGLKIRPVDVAASTMDFVPAALDAADTSRTVAMAATSLYGIPTALPRLEAFAKSRSVALVDDAAQCLDGQVDGRWSGSFGDAGLYSFDKGKNITSLQGGVVTTQDDELADRLAHRFSAMPVPSFGTVAAQSMSLLAYAILLRPSLYWIPNALLTLGETPFELEYPTTQLAPSHAALVGRQFARLDAITESRRRHAERLQAGLAGIPGVVRPSHPGARSVFPRVPIVLEDGARRDGLIAKLRAAGIGATGSYPLPLIDVPGIVPHRAAGIADTPGARSIARGMVTLPTHGHVTPRDLDAMVAVVRAHMAVPAPSNA